MADVGSYVGETLGQIKTVQAYNHQAQDRQRFAGTVERAFDTARKRIAQRAWLITVVIVLVLGAVGIMLWVGGRDVIAGSISAGELAAFVFYSLIVGMAFGTLSEVIGELQRAAGAAERIAELLRARSEIRPPAQPRKLAARVSGRIELQAVRFAYPTRPEHWAIDDISLAVEPGKPWPWSDLPVPASRPCSICSCVSSIRSRDGCCWTDSRSSNWTRLDLRRSFALVSQNPALFFGSVEENIRYGRPHASAAEVEAAARAAHAHEFILGLPQGYATHLGEGGIGLSGGQRQRLAIARALLVDAPVLLLDEATSALDAESEHLIQQALPGLMSGRTTLVIAHRLATVQSADRIAVIDQGRLVAIGSHARLIAENPLYARLAELQFAVGGR